jgi:hypothetical protein
VDGVAAVEGEQGVTSTYEIGCIDHGSGKDVIRTAMFEVE